jgi:quinol monooxygenase YgiN
MIYVATYIDVEPDSTREGMSLLKQYKKGAGSESGNSSVVVLQEISRQNRFVIIEAWKDDASFQAHESAAATASFRSSLKPIHNSPYDQRVHQAFSIGSQSLPERANFCVVTHVDVPPPRREETEVLLRKLAEESRKDIGNLSYDVFQQNAPRTNHFTVFAVWKDEKTFGSYQAAPHTRQFREALGPMLGAPYDERLFAIVT